MMASLTVAVNNDGASRLHVATTTTAENEHSHNNTNNAPPTAAADSDNHNVSSVAAAAPGDDVVAPTPTNANHNHHLQSTDNNKKQPSHKGGRLRSAYAPQEDKKKGSDDAHQQQDMQQQKKKSATSETTATDAAFLQELCHVEAFFASNPHLVEPVTAVFSKYGATSNPRESFEDVTAYTRRVVSDMRQTILAELDATNNEDVDENESFYVCDLARPIIQMAKFKACLPRVHPFYAVKCNGAMPLLEMLSALGAHYDCASKEEINTILKHGLARPDQIIFANPQKMHSHLQYAERVGVRWITFDSAQEVEKIANCMPNARAVLRIATDDSAAVCAFSSKFGARMHQTMELLETAKKNGVTVVGVSFHVGSGNNDPAAYEGAIRNARKVFDQGNSLGFEMKFLDIGGGWPGSDPSVDPESGKPTCLGFEQICDVIRPLMDELFASATIIAEPGRYFAESTYSLAFCVHGARVVKHEDGSTERQYYVGDGLYGAFNCIIYDHSKPQLMVLEENDEAGVKGNTTIWGPTCDSMDCLMRKQPFPAVDIFDWLFVPLFGAYTMAAGSAFNGYSTKQIKFVHSVAL